MHSPTMIPRCVLLLALALPSAAWAGQTPAPEAPAPESPAPEATAPDATPPEATPPEAATAHTARSQDAEPGEARPTEQADGETDQPAVRLLHMPLNSVRGNRRVAIEADIAADWRLQRAFVGVRRGPEAPWSEVDFERASDGSFRAVLPPDLVGEPGFEYFIASVGVDGARRDHFASEAAPHPVTSTGRSELQDQAKRLEVFGGNRSRLRVDSRLLAFGSRPADDDPALQTERFSDRFWQLKAEYLYRPLRLIHDFRFGASVLRGDNPTIEGADEDGGDAPGMNYGYAEITIEPIRWLTLAGRLSLGANEDGFVAGGGGVLRIGPIERSHLAVDVEHIAEVGTRSDLRFHWTTVPRFPMALGIEFTDWPTSEDRPLAANLSYDLGWQASDALTIRARFGTATRAESLNAGLQGGLGVDLGF